MKSIPLASRNFIASEGRLFFTSGDSLWTSNGTPAGTYFIKKTGETFTKMTDLRLGSFIYFTTLQSDGKTALWRTNGTGANTTKIAAFTKITPIIVYNNLLYLGIDDGIHGNELWKINLSNNLSMVKDIFPGLGNGFTNEAIISSGILYFTAATAPAELDIWRTDGTAAGTVKAVDIPFLSGDSDYLSLTDVNGSIFFTRIFFNSGGYEAFELWKTDRTTAGTKKLVTYSNDSAPVEIYTMTSLGNKLFYTSVVDNMWGTLYMSDGTINGTQGLYSFPDEQITPFRHVKDKLVISSINNNNVQTPLIKIDQSGKIANFHRFDRGTGYGDPISTESLLFFKDVFNDSQDELYQSDLNIENTKSLKSLFGTSFAYSGNVTPTNNLIYFTTNPFLSHNPNIRDLKLWFYDPTKPSSNNPYFTLVNADTDKDIQWLKEGDYIFKAEYPHINVRYNTGSVAGSVVFKVNGGIYRTESQPPYALAGDTDGDYNAWSVIHGTYELTAIPYSGSNGSGTAGTALTLQITVADTSSNNLRSEKYITGLNTVEEGMKVYPNPSSENFVFSVLNKESGIAKAEVYRMDGTLVYKILEGDVSEGQQTEFSWNANEQQQGVYLVKYTCGRQQITRKIVLNKW